MHWQSFSDPEDVDKAVQKSFEGFIFILKHSDTCSISHIALMRLNQDWQWETESSYLVEVKSQRQISNYIAEIFNVHHESPQLLIIRNGECVHDVSHFDITTQEIREVLDYHA